MKRALALILCCVMLLTLTVGCKKEEKPAAPDDSRISSDLIDHRAKYSFSHIEGTPSMAGLKIVERHEEDDSIDLKVTATAINEYARIELAADIEYELDDGRWELDELRITKAVPTPTAAPNQESVLMLLDNYISITGSALAAKGEERHKLNVNVRGANWEMKYDEASKTAKLLVEMKSEVLTFKGYYALSFNETGWVIESEKQENGQN